MNNPKDRKKDKSLDDNKIDKSLTASTSSSSSNYDKSLKLGEFIGDAITSKWNSQKKPCKVYVKSLSQNSIEL